MTLHEIPRYDRGVALTEEGGTWYVVTDAFHPHGKDAIGYPSYRDAYAGWKLTVANA